MKKLNFVPLFLFFLVLSSFFVAAAVENLGTFKKGESVRLIQNCASCSYNNITSVLYPNSSTSIGSVLMTKIGSEFNYTLIGNFTNVSGRYIVNGFGDANGTATSWSYEFYITPSGAPQTEARTSAVTRTIYFIFFLAVLLIVAALFVQNFTYKYSMVLISGLLIVVGLNFISIGLQDEVVNPVIQNFFSALVAYSIYIYYFLFFLMAVLWIFSIINTIFLRIKEKKQITDGMGDDFG